jgi:hypothetical protein
MDWVCPCPRRRGPPLSDRPAGVKPDPEPRESRVLRTVESSSAVKYNTQRIYLSVETLTPDIREWDKRTFTKDRMSHPAPIAWGAENEL